MKNYDDTLPAAQNRTVVDFRRFKSGRSLSPIRQAEAYWSALREGFGIPRRTQIDPRGLENLLEYAFILERIAPGIARFRLAGQHLSKLAGMEVRGMPLTTMFTPAGRNTVSAALENVFTAPSIAEMTLTSETSLGHPVMEAHMIVLPLKSDLGDISRALGVFVADGKRPNRPVRFDVTGTASRQISGLTLAPEVAEAEDLIPQRDGFAESASEFRTRPAHLRLIQNND